MEAKRYEGKVKGGNLLLSVHTDTSDQQKRAEAILKDAHASDICATSEASVPNAKESRTEPRERPMRESALVTRGTLHQRHRSRLLAAWCSRSARRSRRVRRRIAVAH